MLDGGMKRGGGFYDGGSAKRIKPADEEIRLLIQSKAGGSVIGKGGHNISKLRTDYKATITVPDCPGPERVLTIQSNEDSMIEILRTVIPALDEGRNKREEGTSEIRVLVHQSQVGAVIGKGGQRIKELRDETGVQVKIYSACAPTSTDRVMQLTGACDDILGCLRKIILLLKDTEPKGACELYDPVNFDEEFSHEYGGYGSEGGGRGGRAGWGGGGRGGSFGGPPFAGRGGDGFMGPQGGYGNDMGFNGMGGPGMGGPGMGGPGMGGPGMGMGPGRYGYGGRGGYSGGRGGGRGESNFKLPSGDMRDGESGDKTTQVSIPKNLVGAIMGKGGARIRKTRADSGAVIKIDDEADGNDRIITITGTEQQIQMAQYLLQQSVREHASGGGY